MKSQGLVTTFMSYKNLNSTILNHNKGDQKAKLNIPQAFRRLVFPFPVATPHPHPLPINRSVNDHSFYWYVQTAYIEMFSAFIETRFFGLHPQSKCVCD